MLSDFEISQRLALAIGWTEDDFFQFNHRRFSNPLEICVGDDHNGFPIW